MLSTATATRCEGMKRRKTRIRAGASQDSVKALIPRTNLTATAVAELTPGSLRARHLAKKKEAIQPKSANHASRIATPTSREHAALFFHARDGPLYLLLKRFASASNYLADF